MEKKTLEHKKEPLLDSYLYGHLICEKYVMIDKWGKDRRFNKWG